MGWNTVFRLGILVFFFFFFLLQISAIQRFWFASFDTGQFLTNYSTDWGFKGGAEHWYGLFFFFSSSSLLACKLWYKLLGRVRWTGWLTQRDKQERPLSHPIFDFLLSCTYCLLPISATSFGVAFLGNFYSFLIISKQQCKIAGRSWLHAVFYKYVIAERWDII